MKRAKAHMRKVPPARLTDCRAGGSSLVNDDSIGKSESRENLSSDEGTFLQEYYVYFKKK